MGNFLYNDVGPLPDIRSVYTPELQSKYPNACIVYYETQGLYHLYATQVPGYVYWIVVKGEFVSLGDGLSQYLKAELDASSSEWVDKSPEYTDPETSGGYSANFDVKAFVWSNHDIYYPDDYSHDPALAGTLKFAASEPVPVGIAPKIDPFSMTMGWLAGSRIAGQRGKAG